MTQDTNSFFADHFNTWTYLFETFGLTNALIVIVTRQTIELNMSTRVAINK